MVEGEGRASALHEARGQLRRNPPAGDCKPNVGATVVACRRRPDDDSDIGFGWTWSGLWLGGRAR